MLSLQRPSWDNVRTHFLQAVSTILIPTQIACSFPDHFLEIDEIEVVVFHECVLGESHDDDWL